MSDFSKLLNTYGFKTEAQQLNVIRLLYLAGCFDQDKLYVDLIATGHASLQVESAMELVRQAISADQHSKNPEKFNVKLILDKLFFSSYEVAEKGGWPENIHN